MKHKPIVLSHKSWMNFPRIVVIAILLVCSMSHSYAGKPPKELSRVIDHFMKMDSTSLEISQVIDWRFSSKYDSISLQMDVGAVQNFRLTLADFGMEIFVTPKEMITLNHVRAQVLYEKTTPNALINQIFVGGDLADAVFKKEKILSPELRQLDFIFKGDFSDWERLSVTLDVADDLKKMVLTDYDGNKYLISINYRSKFKTYQLPNIQRDYLHYQVADLRE